MKTIKDLKIGDNIFLITEDNICKVCTLTKKFNINYYVDGSEKVSFVADRLYQDKRNYVFGWALHSNDIFFTEKEDFIEEAKKRANDLSKTLDDINQVISNLV